MSDKPRLLDLFCGEGGAGMGYHRAGFDVFGVDNAKTRLKYYPFNNALDNAIDFLYERHHMFDAIHASPPCTGYSRATSALPDRLTRYDRLIPVVREVLDEIGKPYVIENVYDARKELKDPKMLCGRMFDLTAIDDDGTKLVMDRHRLFETNWDLEVPEHEKHDKSLQVAGSYGGARRDKDEARNVRKGGYVPPNLEVQRALLGIDWASEKGCWLSIPPVYTEFIGKQLLEVV
jgi:DNA (cytosine-5)-methyltransferase 1